MTAIPEHKPLPIGDAVALDSQRLAKAMERWRRRSRVIHFWRVALPGLIALICAGVLTQIVIGAFAAGRPSNQDESIRMLNPKFFGRDKSDRPFTVTAKDAIRDGAHPERVALSEPHLVLQSLNGAPPTVVDAATGLYNETTHMLALDGQVRTDDGKSDIFVSEHALVNTDQGTVDGRSPVTGTGPLGQITASSYAVFDRGDHVAFYGNVKSHLVNK
jgi:lipopolysaccharide export system protein LptC